MCFSASVLSPHLFVNPPSDTELLEASNDVGESHSPEHPLTFTAYANNIHPAHNGFAAYSAGWPCMLYPKPWTQALTSTHSGFRRYWGDSVMILVWPSRDAAGNYSSRSLKHQCQIWTHLHRYALAHRSLGGCVRVCVFPLWPRSPAAAMENRQIAFTWPGRSYAVIHVLRSWCLIVL